MATTFALKEDQQPQSDINNVEVIATITKEETRKETTCLRKIDALIQGIDEEILRLMDEKDRLQVERTFILAEAQKFQLEES